MTNENVRFFRHFSATKIQLLLNLQSFLPINFFYILSYQLDSLTRTKTDFPIRSLPTTPQK